MRTDNGGEFIGKDFKKILRSFAITQEFTAPRTPEQNAIVERSISLIYRNAIINLEHAGIRGELRSKLYAEAVSHATDVMNISYHRELKMSPMEIMQILLPDYMTGELPTPPTFGSISYIINKDRKKSEMDARGEKALFVGMAKNKIPPLWRT